jgi:hypothetical protein
MTSRRIGSPGRKSGHLGQFKYEGGPLKDLNKKAFAGLFFLLLVMAALLFVPAWGLGYWQAWALLAVCYFLVSTAARNRSSDSTSTGSATVSAISWRKSSRYLLRSL